MKKQANRLIALVISMVMLISMLPMGYLPVYAETVTDQTETPAETTIQANEVEEILPHCICGGAAAGIGEHVCNENVTWSPWAKGETYNDGAYYLTEDVVLYSTIGLEGTLSIDLNGHDLTISTNGTKQIFSVAAGGILNICDSVGGGSVTATSVATGTSGAIVNANVGGATVNIFGGTFDVSGIQGSVNQGVAFNIVGSTLNMYGGTIIGTVTSNHGGAVYVNMYGNNTANAVGGYFNMYSGEIYGGTSDQGSGNLFVGGNAGKDDAGNAVSGAVNLLGGTIYGSAVTTGKTVSVGGSMKVLQTKKDGTAANCGLWVKDSNTVTVLALNNDAEIYLDKNTNTNAAVFGTDVTAQAYGQVRVGAYTIATVAPAYEDVAYLPNGSALKLGEGRYGCLCGHADHVGDCNGTVLVWLPTDGAKSNGNYYLTTDLSAPIVVAQGKTLNLDLNGHKITSSTNNILTLDGEDALNIVDTVGTGEIIATGKFVANVVGANSVLSIYGGKLQSTVTTINANGGTDKNVGTVNIYGGTIVGGSASYGGAVYINSGCKLNMTGGTVYGGTATSNGDNIFMGGSAGNSYITGGTVYGGPNHNAITTTGGMLYLGGSAKVYDYLNDENNTAANGIYTTAPTKIKILPLNNDAVIRFKGAAGAKVAILDSTTENKNYAQLLGAGNELVALPNESGELYLTAGKLHCLCAQDTHIGECSGEVLLWTPWSSTTLPTATGNYYLTADVSAGGQAIPAANAVINLDLNGKSFAPAQNAGSAVGNYWRPYVLDNAGSVLNITDSVGGGKICGGVRGDAGMVVRINKAATLNLYAGTLDGSTSVETTSSAFLGAVQLNTGSNGVFNMYGGKVIGISANPTHIKDNEPTGNTVAVNGTAVNVAPYATFNQVGGEIDGTVYIQYEISWVIDGETAKTVVVKGNVPAKAKPVKDGYIFKGWSLTDGGEVLASLPVAAGNATYYAVFEEEVTSATVTWTNWDGTVLEVDEDVAIGSTPVYDGTAPTRDADSNYIYEFKGWSPEVSAVTGNVTYKASYQWYDTIAQVGQTYYKGLETALNAANGGTVVLMSDVTISKSMGINVGVDITIDLNGYSIKASDTFPVKSNMFSVAGKLTVKDSVGTGSIDASAATSAEVGGIAIIANNATGEIVIESGKIIGGNTTNFGGAVYINGGAKLTMTGGIISGGSSEQKGNTLFVGGNAATEVKLLGGTIYGGIWGTGSNISVGGSAKILQTLESGEDAAYGLKVEGSNYVTVLALNDDAVIYLDKTTGLNNAIAVFGEGVESKNYLQLMVGAATAADQMPGKDAIIQADGEKLYVREGRLGCLCGHTEHIGSCDGTVLLWKPLTGNTLPSATGNYYLTGNLDAAAQGNVAANAVVNLDLNGFTVTMAPNPAAAVEGGTYNYHRAFALNNDGAVLNITDSVGGGAILGGVRGMGGIVINIQSNSVVNLYGGTLNGTLQSESTSDKNIYGTVAVLDGATLNVYGGSILGMDKQVQRIDQATNTAIENTYVTVNGSAIYVAEGGNASISGGQIVGGMAGNGGAIFNVGSLNISGGQIVGGVAANGGAIYSTGDIQMSGGEIIGSNANDFGGVMYLNNGAVMTMTGGEISGGTAGQKGNTLFVGGSAGSIQLLGGTVYGGVWTTGSSVSVGGSVNILQTLKNGDAAEYGLKVEESNTVTVLALDETAAIYLDKAANQTKPVAVFGEGVEVKLYDQLHAGAASIDALLNNVQGAGIHLLDEKLYLTAGEWDCVCRQDVHTQGCDQELIFWRVWTNAKELPTSGSYYLVVDVADAKQVSVGGTLNLDLNGHSVRVGQNPGAVGGTDNSWRVLYMTDDTDVLNITDSVGGGTVYGGKRHDAGHIIYILDCDATFNLHAGTLSGEEIEDTNSKKGQTSGVVYSTKSGTFNMYGGEIVGWNGLSHADTDRLAEDGYNAVIGIGASVTFAGTFNMYGGVIRDGNAIPGNAGSIGDGGNVFMLEGSTFNMYGGTITGGTAQYGGNVFIAAGATYNYVAGTIENGNALIYGDDVFCVEDSELIYTVTFQDENGETLQTEQLYRGTIPEYDGVITKAPNGTVTYEHIGWNPGVAVVTGDVVYTPIFDETIHDFLVKQWDVNFGDALAVNFKVNVREDLVETASLQISVGDEEPVNYKLSSLTKNEDGTYTFVTQIAAAQMADIIVLQIVNGEELGESFTCTVEQYAESVLADSSKSDSHAVVKEMLNYAAKAQIYFGYNTENIVGDNVDLSAAGAKDISGTEAADIVIDGSTQGIDFYGASFIHGSKLAVRFYFSGDLSGATVKVGDKTLTPAQKNGKWYVEVDGINPQDLDQPITVVVNGSLSVTYSPMNYMVRMSVNGSDDLKALLKALYNFHLAVKAMA